MPRDSRLYLEDMLTAARKVRAYTTGITYDEFIEADMRIDAVTRNLEIIGEAAKRVPGAVREAHPEIPWRRITGFRDIVVHEYFGLDLALVWNVIVEEIPRLESAVATLLDEKS